MRANKIITGITSHSFCKAGSSDSAKQSRKAEVMTNREKRSQILRMENP